jgi:trehalose 6-phosphate phosphatase
MSQTRLDEALRHLRAGGRLWLFLDYDGTLVPIARTPDEARPAAKLLGILGGLAKAQAIRTVVLSGRPLASLRQMIPVDGLRLAGTYGLEIQRFPEPPTLRVDPLKFRSTVEQVKGDWAEVIGTRAGFYLEDKGLAIALHARFASPADADCVLPAARKRADKLIDTNLFRILGGHRFLEVAPAAAHKGKTVEWLLEQSPWPDALLVYFGDDDKDEEAFAVVRQRRGIPVVVGEPRGPTQALVRLESPAAVGEWIGQFLTEGQSS